MDGAISFAMRIVCAFTAFFVYLLLTHETIRRAKFRQFDLAFLLALSCSGVALGLFISQGWGAYYHYNILSGRPAEWMLDSWVVTAATGTVLVSAAGLIYTLTPSFGRSVLYISITVIAGIVGFICGGGLL